MDTNKLFAPLHIRCPKCGADLEYNPRRIKERLENATTKYMSLQRRLPSITDKADRKKKIKEIEQLQRYMKLLKEDRNMISRLLKEETDRIMKEKLKEKIGEEEWMRMLQEAEAQARDENVFHTYELAIQNFSNIPENAK